MIFLTVLHCLPVGFLQSFQFCVHLTNVMVYFRKTFLQFIPLLSHYHLQAGTLCGPVRNLIQYFALILQVLDNQRLSLINISNLFIDIYQPRINLLQPFRVSPTRLQVLKLPSVIFRFTLFQVRPLKPDFLLNALPLTRQFLVQHLQFAFFLLLQS